jgi:hypothetical protein
MMRIKITRTPLREWVRGAAELWRCRVPIGDTLAEARQRAGLTVAQVSEQTCIKETVIAGIEGGDYSACGGDFYARANIRSIAKVVGADAGPLVAEYGALHRAPGALRAVSLEELLATSAPAGQRRWPRWSAVGGLVASGNGPAYRRPRGRWLYWVVVLGLVAVLGFGVYSRFFGLRHASAAPSPRLPHAAVPAPAPKLTHAAVAPTPAAAAPAQTLTPARAGAPGRGGGSRPPAPRATGGSRAPRPAHPAVRHRPLAEPVPQQRAAHERERPGHDHGRRDHRHRRAPAEKRLHPDLPRPE